MGKKRVLNGLSNYLTPLPVKSASAQRRVPYWSQQTKVRAGAYLTLARCWQPGDTIDLEMDLSMHYWQGEEEGRDRSRFLGGRCS